METDTVMANNIQPIQCINDNGDQEQYHTTSRIYSKVSVRSTNSNATSSSKQTQNSNYRLVRNLKQLLRKTTGFVSPTQDFILSHGNEGPVNTNTSVLGPITYQSSVKEILKYANINNISLPTDNFCASYRKLQLDGISMQKITRNKHKWYLFKLDTDNSAVKWKFGNKRLELDAIRDVRIGNMASNYREEYGVSDSYADLWMTIIYSVSNKLKALHIISEDKQKFDTFLNCICGLVMRRRQLMESISIPDSDKFAKIHWNTTVSERVEDESNDTLTFSEVTKLCKRFHIYCSRDHLWKIFNIADINHNQLLNFSEFQYFVKLLRERKEVNIIWNKLSQHSGSLDIETFYHFVKHTQKEDSITFDECEVVFNKYKSPTSVFMDEEGFLKYLSNIPFMNDSSEQNSDYSQPLNHYFIASSHNTYLLGKQFAETPSVEAYIQVLQQGCRSIEIDIWDDEKGPVVCHGALTAAIPLVNVFKVIRKYAFISSPFPLIVSLEIHCNKENQKIINNNLKEIFNDLLYLTNSDETILPSPLELRHKIIVKAKKPKNLILDSSGITTLVSRNGSSNDENLFSFTSSQNDDSEESNSTASSPPLSLFASSVNVKSDSTSSAYVAEPTNFNRIKRIGHLKGRTPVIKEILDNSTIHGLKYRNFSLPESKTTAHCFSLNEKKVDSMSKESSLKLAIDKHNRRYLMRIYPHALRYKSSNFNPINYWKLGTQMVATNWQTNDLGQQINLAMFQLTNQKNEISHSGYVLKPKSLITPVPKVNDIVNLYRKLQDKYIKNPFEINIRILSAQLLPKIEKKGSSNPNFAPYVSLKFINDDSALVKSLHNLKNCVKVSDLEIRTNTCPGNGFNPVWETEVSFTVSNLDFSFVQFIVKTDEIPLAVCTIKLEYLKSGYRHIPLYNVEGEQYIFSTLFIYSEISNKLS